MKTTFQSVVAGLAVATVSAPAWASSVAVPEPGSLSLLALGVAGAVIGHRFWRNK